ncbi:hypothetical protein OHA72_63490 [Dactylosporangium sp. NBC_01737]|uniref:hypothetical protein n=1 Tax=Dactylosporangium sp. NBC_01737 TaxID=2975959 RepID=UPI002E10F48E|nr:hypothetical protein OHA72_63490 [Dactylosporangium sp. NBC_01737]
MTTESDLPATGRRVIHWGPIGVAVAGVATVALTAVLVYPLTQPSERTSADGMTPEQRRSAEMAGLPGAASPTASRSPSPSVSASPSASPTAAPRVVSRGGGKPAAGNTGVIAGTTLTVLNGDQTLATDNAVVANADIRGYVRITGKNVTLRNSIVRGGAARCSAAVVQVEGSAVIEDVEIAPASPNACLDGVWAAATTLTRVNIHGTVDGVKAGNDVTVQDSWIHDLTFYRSGAPGGGETVNDAVDTRGKRRITLRHNVLYPGANANAAYQVTQEGGASGDIRVESNWLDGGHCVLNFAHRGGGPTPMTGIAVVNNRFGRNSMFVCPILISTQTSLSANSGNVWDDTGAAIPAPDKHD